jgi:hypothetical protein
MKKFIVYILALLFSICAYTQTIQYEDVIYLKNGSVVRGMIIEQIPNKTLKIKTADRNIFVFEFDKIEKITKEEIPQEVTEDQVQEIAPVSDYVAKENGFEATVDMFFAIDLQWGEPVIGLHAIAGYRIMPQLFIGGGTGVELYSEGNLMPLFINIRTDFVESRVSPFFATNMGYALGWVNNADGSDWGGVFIEPSFGFRFNINQRFGINISSSIKFQRAYYNDHYYNYSYPDNETYYYDHRNPTTYRLFSFKVGFSF